jgi:hypothetical protein
VPLHGTGELFDRITKAEMPAKLFSADTGNRFVLGP